MKTYTTRLRKAWRSRTIWFNAVAALGLAWSNDILSLLPQLQVAIGPHDYRMALTFITVANVVLRFMTTHPLEAK